MFIKTAGMKKLTKIQCKMTRSVLDKSVNATLDLENSTKRVGTTT